MTIYKSKPSNTYYDPHQQAWVTKILPGEMAIHQSPHILVTTLGSCISACIYDLKAGWGGMNHFLLPFSHTGEWAGVTAEERYGNFAMERMVNALLEKGCLKGNLKAKIFGGGDFSGKENGNGVGKQNIFFVKDYLKIENIPIEEEDLGGDLSRKIYFQPSAGLINIKHIKVLPNTTIQEREKTYKNQIKTLLNTNKEIELF
jgi:chemotaxis protein CheD